MKTRLSAFMACIVFCFTVTTNGGESKQPAAAVIGYWKIDSATNTALIHISATQLISGQRAPVDIALDNKDGRAVMRLAGTDTIMAIIEVENEERIILHDQGSNAKDAFIRITQEDFDREVR